jgi:hypothetical protein
VIKTINAIRVFLFNFVKLGHVRWAPCHHSMARPQVAVVEEGLQIWRVAANILNKQSRTIDKGWSSSLGERCGDITPDRKKVICYEMFQSASDLN